MKESEIKALMRGIAPVVADYVKQATAPLHERIAALEARPALKFCGAWKKGTEYSEGNLVIHNGSLWLAGIASTSCRPGDGTIWILAAKKALEAAG